MRVRWVSGARGEGWFAIFGLAGAAFAAAWLLAGFPTPRCVFHAATGLPCVSCGGTRALRSALQGEFNIALGWNPLVVAVATLALLLVAYAMLVSVFRWPRLRVTEVTPHDLKLLRWGLAIVLVANWIHLLFRFAA